MIFSDPSKAQVSSEFLTKQSPPELLSVSKSRRQQQEPKKEKLTFEFIIGEPTRPEYKLEVQVRKDRKMEEENIKVSPDHEANQLINPEKFFGAEEKVNESEIKVENNPIESEIDVKSEEKDEDFDQLFENEITIEIPRDNFIADEPSQNSTLSMRRRRDKKPKVNRNLEHLAQLVNEWYFTFSAQVIKELQKIYSNSIRNKVISFNLPNYAVHKRESLPYQEMVRTSQ